MLSRIQVPVQHLVRSTRFEWFIIVLILINSVLLGLETSVSFMQSYGGVVNIAYDVILWVFVAEIALKWIGFAPNVHNYFKSGWNVFDFLIVAVSFLPSGGSWVAVARMARLMRVLRLITAVPRLQFIVKTLLSSVPSMFNVVLLMAAIFYIYAIIGFQLFHEHDPVHWESLGMSLLTLFRIVTLEDWTDVMYTAMEISPYMCFYFVTFVVIGTFVFVNLFVAVMLKNADKIHDEETEEMDEIRDDIAELKALLQQHMNVMHQHANAAKPNSGQEE